MSVQTIDFDCPFCHVKIPAEYMKAKTRVVDYKGMPKICCLQCAKEYEAAVMKCMEVYAAKELGAPLGMTTEQAMALRQESEHTIKEDERLVDEEVDVRDAEKAKRIFKRKGDQHEERKTPLQIMREMFIKGIRKAGEKKIIVPGSPGFNLKKGNA